MPVPIGATTLELETVSELVMVSELVIVSLLLGEISPELLAIDISPLDSGAPSQLLEEAAAQLQVVFPAKALMFSVSQATSVRARSDTAESPQTMLVILFFIGL